MVRSAVRTPGALARAAIQYDVRLEPDLGIGIVAWARADPPAGASSEFTLASERRHAGRDGAIGNPRAAREGEEEECRLAALQQQSRTRTKSAADCEAIEHAYRAGVLTNREIATQNGITEGAIRKKAKREGWRKNLSARVQEKVRADLVRAEVRPPAGSNQSERQIVDEAAAQVVTLVREHRVDICRLRETGGTLWQQLVDAIGNREWIELAIQEDTEV